MLIMLLCMSAALWAVPAKPGLKRVLTLTDGTTITAQLVGDEHGHFWLGQDGRAYQAVSGSDVFQLIDKTEVTKRAQTRRAAAKVIAASTSDGLGKYGQSGLGAFNSIGEYTIPVIMVQFSNKQFLPTTTVEKMTRFYNEEGYHDEEGCMGSVRDYFKSQSRGMFVPTFDVVGIVTLNHEYAYYGAGDESVSKVKEFASDAVKAAISQLGTDFSQYVRTTTNVNGSTTGVPLVCIFYAGYGQATGSMDDDEEDTVWPCEVDWNTSVQGTKFNSFFVGNELYDDGELMGMGVFCHETGHALGLPDFYCTDYSYNQDDPFGNWSIMDCGAYVNDARAPIGYTAYERSYLGWLDIPTYTAGSNKTLDPYTTEDGTTAVKVATNDNTEYFILENRQPGTWYPESMGSGLMVSRFAYSNTYWSYNTLNNTQRSKRAMIVTADGAKLYYSGDQKNLYGNGVNSITSLKRYRSGTINPQINNITKNTDGTITLNAAVAPPDPLIVADESLMFKTAVGIPQTLTFDILSEGLTEDISASLNDENNVFSMDKTTISRVESEDGVSVSVTFTPVSAGNYTGTITLASAGADDVTVSLSATATLPVPDSNRYELVTDASTLETGDKVLIAYINGDTKQVMSTTQNSNNRAATTDITLNDDNTLTPGNAAQVITLEKDGSNFLFNVGDGYLYAASSSNKKNYLRTEEIPDDNAKATISIRNGIATIKFQGANTNNTMRYNPNNNSPIFSCYASSSTTGSLPQIYRQKKVEPVTVSIGSTGYATLYYSDKNLVVPEGVNAYTYTITDGKLEESWVYEADEVIPQGTAVILKDLVALEEGVTSHDYAFTVTTTEGDVDPDNLLMGFDEEAETVGPDGATEGYKFYMLSLDKNSTPGSVGFYYGKNGGAAFTSKAHKAYLPVPDTAAHGKSFFLFSEAETATTDINNVQSSRYNAQSAEIYDLSGRKIVGSKLQPGIYIMNGRKVVVK